jgi:hypothetical protein
MTADNGRTSSMEKIERRVWREARAMTRREVIAKAIAKQLSWVETAEISESSRARCGALSGGWSTTGWTQ